MPHSPASSLLTAVLVVTGALVLGAAGADLGPLGPLEREAGACSCVGPRFGVIGPVRADDVPLNAVVRVGLPNGKTPGAKVVVRPRQPGGGPEVATTSRAMDTGGWVQVVELRPRAPLAPSTTYEIATVAPDHVPPVTVYAAFTTGAAADTTAPTLDATGAVTAFRNPNAQSAACQVEGPWITVQGVKASDRDRPGAHLLYGVWAASAAGVIDPKAPPTTVLEAQDGTLVIGKNSMCSPQAFPLPKTGAVTLGIAALDEAGNASAMKVLKVDISKAQHP